MRAWRREQTLEGATRVWWFLHRREEEGEPDAKLWGWPMSRGGAEMGGTELGLHGSRMAKRLSLYLFSL